MPTTPYSGRPQRRTVRLSGFDYASPGAYFITVCTYDRHHLLGEVVDGAMQLSEVGHLATRLWQDIPAHRPYVSLDAFVAMPDHIHGVMVIKGGARTHSAAERFGQPTSGSVASIIRLFKGSVTAAVNRAQGACRGPVWQRGYYERVIRGPAALGQIRRYIVENPARWQTDPDPPRHTPPLHPSP